MAGPQINTILRIDEVFAAISVDDDGTEGICAVRIGNDWMPLLAADKSRLPFVEKQAEMIAKAQSRLVKIIRLHSREELRQIDGRQ